MFEAPRYLLINNESDWTPHVFVRLEDGEFIEPSGQVTRVYRPIFRCEKTGAERVFGCLRSDLTLWQLEDEFGPLDESLHAVPVPTSGVADARIARAS